MHPPRCDCLASIATCYSSLLVARQFFSAVSNLSRYEQLPRKLLLRIVTCSEVVKGEIEEKRKKNARRKIPKKDAGNFDNSIEYFSDIGRRTIIFSNIFL